MKSTAKEGIVMFTESRIPVKPEFIDSIIETFKKDAESTISNAEKLDELLQKFEEMLAQIPGVGEKLTEIPAMISLVLAYSRGEYTVAPIGSIIAITAAIIYAVTPLDLIPDTIPGVGLVDDAAVLAFVEHRVHEDVEKYKKWQEENGRR